MSDLSQLGNTQDEMGAVLPSKIEQATYQKTLYANRIMDVGSDQQKQIDYTIRPDGQPVYVGYAPRGHATSATGWLLQKMTYDVSDRVTSITIAWNSWDNRAAATYA